MEFLGGITGSWVKFCELFLSLDSVTATPTRVEDNLKYNELEQAQLGQQGEYVLEFEARLEGMFQKQKMGGI